METFVKDGYLEDTMDTFVEEGHLTGTLKKAMSIGKNNFLNLFRKKESNIGLLE